MRKTPKQFQFKSKLTEGNEIKNNCDNNLVISRKLKNQQKMKLSRERCDNNNLSDTFTSSDYSSDSEESTEVMRDNIIRSDKQINYISWLIIPIILIIVAIGCWTCLINVLSRSQLTTNAYNDGFAQMRSKFHNLKPISWKMLNISLYRQMFRAPSAEKPAVIILLGSKQRVEQFRSDLVRLILLRCPSYRINEGRKHSDELKLDLIGFLEGNLGNGCVYLGDIEQIPAALGPLLQGLTDELNAKHKQMIYIFSMESQSPLDDEKEAEIFVVDRLRLVWADEMGEERFVALHTRLVVNVVQVF